MHKDTHGIPVEILCPRCGETYPEDTAEIVDGVVYCSDCGFALAGPDPEGKRAVADVEGCYLENCRAVAGVHGLCVEHMPEVAR